MDDFAHWLTPSAAGRELGVSAQRVRQLIEQGRLAPWIKTSLGRLISTEAVAKEKAARLVGASRA